MARRLYLLLVFFLLKLSLFSQTNSYEVQYATFSAKLPDQPYIRDSLKSSILYLALTPFEQEFIYYLNYARLYPKLFSKNAVLAYLEAYPSFRPTYGEGLVSQLSSGKALSLLLPDSRLVELARQHVSDVAQHDLMSHNSSNGTQMQQRFAKAGLTCGSECINMLSSGSALEVLLSLLVDFNVQNLGHRKSLLGESMIAVGVGSKSSKKGFQYTVVDLTCQ